MFELKSGRSLVSSYFEDGFVVDFFFYRECYEAWIRHQDYGIAVFICGVSVVSWTLDEFVESILNPEYIAPFMNEYKELYFDKS